MARKFGPFDTSVFYEVENRRLQRAFNPQTGFVKTGQGAVTAGTGAELIIAAYPDGALVDGLYVENPASETVTLTTNTASTNPRIDRLVMRLDMTAKTIEPFQIVGTPASSPSAPALTQTATKFDMPLCQYRFPGSASAQNPGSIVDERVTLGAPSTVLSGQGVAFGTTPTADKPMIIQAFSRVVPANTNGDATIVFPSAFPAGLASVVATSGDLIAGNHAYAAIISTALNSINTRHFQPGGGPCASVSVRVNVIAVGW